MHGIIIAGILVQVVYYVVFTPYDFGDIVIGFAVALVAVANLLHVMSPWVRGVSETAIGANFGSFVIGLWAIQGSSPHEWHEFVSLSLLFSGGMLTALEKFRRHA